MRVSIAMATYNGARYIKEQLQSFAVQTKLPDELVITDDCSTDDTIEIIKEFAKTSSFEVRWSVNSQKMGYSGNFNQALMNTTGGFVFLSDQDDVWLPQKIETMLNIAGQHQDCLLFMNDAELTDAKLNSTGLTKIGQILSGGMTLNSFVMGCCCLINRELLNICLPIPENYNAHDDWLVQTAEAIKAKHVVNKVLQYYRRHDANESQFIANRTTKITRKDVILNAIKAMFSKEKKARLQESMQLEKVFINGLENALQAIPSKYKLQLADSIAARKEKLAITETRIAIRKKKCLRRIIAVISLFAKGGYGKTSGGKALARDILAL